MSDVEWARVRPLLPIPAWLGKRAGRPESYCHRQMIDAVRYVVDNGIKWRAMPADFPCWERVYAFFRRWREHGLIAEFHDRLREQVRARAGRNPQPSAGIVDSQSVKAAANVPAASRGYDGNKKINGRRRHIVTDTLGLLLTVRVAPADIGDRDAFQGLLPFLSRKFHRLRLIWADGGYTGPVLAGAAKALNIVLEVVKRTDDTKGFKILPRRWVVERSFGWLMRSRRLARDFETTAVSAEAMILWSMTMVMSRRLAGRPRA
jgi:transposase